jgi:triosephosphate isomerase (TIM)
MDSRKPLIAGNWKMFKTLPEAERTAAEIVRLTAGITGVDILIAPPFTALSGVYRIVAGTNVSLGAQNLFWEKEGAFTGEISPAMLMDAGCSHVIIGHSERRQYFSETDETVNKKIRAAINFSLIPVLCVGETEKERDAGQTFYVLDKQIKKGLEGFSFEDVARLVVAYEPVWAIGTGKTATREQAQEVHHFLRGLLEKLFGKTASDTVRILYGGSVKPGNIKELMDMPDVDGALVGGASLDAPTFSAIVHYNP